MLVYQTFADGDNRVDFRHAMAKHTSGQFIWRKSKGETSGVLVLAIRQRFNEIRKLLLEGQFAKKGLLNTTVIEQQLSEFRHGKIEELWPLLNLLVTEMWLQSWNIK